MKEDVIAFIDSLDITSIDADRKLKLNPLVDEIVKRKKAGTDIHVNFICTHNSRRSILSQVWAQTLADYYSVQHFQAFSGGTESTGIPDPIIATLHHAGFKLEKIEGDMNPIHYISFSSKNDPVKAYSKVYDDPANPSGEFIAVLTCSDADENCPHIPGAEARIPIPFQDPKAYDGKTSEAEQYNITNKQIATELKYVFDSVG